MKSVTPADLMAVADVFRDVDELSDSLDIESAVELLQAAKTVAKSLRTTIGLIETQLCNTLESPRTIDGRLYEVKSDGKWRPDHSKVQAAVKQHSMVDTQTGEMFDTSGAVDRCMTIMHNLYVSPQGMPKVGGLEQIGLDKPDVAHYDRVGKRLSVQEVIE